MRENRLLGVVLLAPVSLVSVIFLWEKVWVLFLALSVISVSILYLRDRRRDLVFFVFSGLAGTAAEAIATVFGTWTYTSSQLSGVPVWLPLLWGIAAMFLVSFHEILDMYVERNFP